MCCYIHQQEELFCWLNVFLLKEYETEMPCFKPYILWLKNIGKRFSWTLDSEYCLGYFTDVWNRWVHKGFWNASKVSCWRTMDHFVVQIFWKWIRAPQCVITEGWNVIASEILIICYLCIKKLRITSQVHFERAYFRWIIEVNLSQIIINGFMTSLHYELVLLCPKWAINPIHLKRGWFYKNVLICTCWKKFWRQFKGMVKTSYCVWHSMSASAVWEVNGGMGELRLLVEGHAFVETEAERDRIVVVVFSLKNWQILEAVIKFNLLECVIAINIVAAKLIGRAKWLHKLQKSNVDKQWIMLWYIYYICRIF